MEYEIDELNRMIKGCKNQSECFPTELWMKDCKGSKYESHDYL